VAFDASPSISLGGALSLLGGSWDTDYSITWTEDGGGEYRYFDETDIDGVTGSVGMLYRFEPTGRFALSADFPKKLSTDGVLTEDDIQYSIEDDITLPFSVSAGLAFTLPHVVLALDVKYTDWSQIDYEGPVRVEDAERRRLNVYDDAAQVRLGAEFLVPNAPLRLRAGYMYDPVPYKLVFTDDRYYVGETGDERDYFTFGAGVILEESFSLDAAIAFGGFERSAVSTVEDLSQNKVFVSAGYRY
jgi:long-subunit fatty acid transport protein